MKLYRRAAGSSKFQRIHLQTNQTPHRLTTKTFWKGTFWVHSRVAIHLVNWCGLTTDLDSLLSHIPIDTFSLGNLTERPTPEETEDSKDVSYTEKRTVTKSVIKERQATL
jgi:hypothetical protein